MTMTKEKMALKRSKKIPKSRKKDPPNREKGPYKGGGNPHGFFPGGECLLFPPTPAGAYDQK